MCQVCHITSTNPESHTHGEGEGMDTTIEIWHVSELFMHPILNWLQKYNLCLKMPIFVKQNTLCCIIKLNMGLTRTIFNLKVSLLYMTIFVKKHIF